MAHKTSTTKRLARAQRILVHTRLSKMDPATAEAPVTHEHDNVSS